LHTPTNSLDDFKALISMIGKACPNLRLLNIDGNPLVDKIINAELDTQDLLE